MWGLVAAGNVFVVLAQDHDRFVRNSAHLYLLREEFAQHGTARRALNDRGDQSPAGADRLGDRNLLEAVG